MNKSKIYWILTILLAVIFMSVIPYTVFKVKSGSEDLQNDVTISSVKEEARRMTNALKIVRNKYTKNVIETAKECLNVTHDYADPKWKDSTKKAIPLPATLSMEIAEGLSKEGTEVSLYSKFPFPWRDKGGALERKITDFQSRAYDYFVKNHNGEIASNLEFFEFDVNQRVLNYAIPDLMVNNTCVNCHNTRAESPKTDWKLGDVRGAISVRLPITKDEGITEKIVENTNGTRNLLIFMATVGFFIFLVIYLSNKEQNKIVEQINEMAVNDLKEQEKQFDSELEKKDSEIKSLKDKLGEK